MGLRSIAALAAAHRAASAVDEPVPPVTQTDARPYRLKEGDRVQWQPDPVLHGTVREAANGVVRVDWDEGGYSFHREPDLILVPDPGGGDG